MVRKKTSKKGELTTQQIVTLVVLIASFAVILFLIFRLNLRELSDKEICHNSVMLKSTSRNILGKLDCKTNYLCISGGGECKDIVPSSTVKVDASNKDEIMKAIADEMADCWWMFGEGGADYLNIKEEGLSKTTCAVCSMIRFDSVILSKNYQISFREFYEYLNSINKDESQTYLMYLQGTSDASIGGVDDFILEDEKYAIITGVKKNIKFWPPSSKGYIIYPAYIKLSQMSSTFECDEFITKA